MDGCNGQYEKHPQTMILCLSFSTVSADYSERCIEPLSFCFPSVLSFIIGFGMKSEKEKKKQNYFLDDLYIDPDLLLFSIWLYVTPVTNHFYMNYI